MTAPYRTNFKDCKRHFMLKVFAVEDPLCFYLLIFFILLPNYALLYFKGCHDSIKKEICFAATLITKLIQPKLI